MSIRDLRADHRDDDRRTDRPEAFRSTRMVAVIAVLSAGVILENGFVGNVPYFVIGVVLFVVGVLAIRAPQIFWTPVSRAHRPSAHSQSNTSGNTAVATKRLNDAGAPMRLMS